MCTGHGHISLGRVGHGHVTLTGHGHVTDLKAVDMAMACAPKGDAQQCHSKVVPGGQSQDQQDQQGGGGAPEQ